MSANFNRMIQEQLLRNRIAELGAENLTLHRKLAGETLRADQGWERYEAANRRANAAEAALAKAQEDARRLDYLIRNEVQVWEMNRRYSIHDVTEHHAITGEFMTARDAIDALRETAAPTPDSEQPQAGGMITEVKK